MEREDADRAVHSRPREIEEMMTPDRLGQFILDENPYVAPDEYYIQAIEREIGKLEEILSNLRVRMSASNSSDEPEVRASARQGVTGYGDTVAGPGAENGGLAKNRGGGRLIVKPDTTDLKNPLSYDAVHKRVMSGLFWDFGGKTHRISKAFRIPYRITNRTPDDPEEYNIFIGYGGCGGW
jgi:hypothetical protein